MIAHIVVEFSHQAKLAHTAAAVSVRTQRPAVTLRFACQIMCREYVSVDAFDRAILNVLLEQPYFTRIFRFRLFIRTLAFLSLALINFVRDGCILVKDFVKQQSANAGVNARAGCRRTEKQFRFLHTIHIQFL